LIRALSAAAASAERKAARSALPTASAAAKSAAAAAAGPRLAKRVVAACATRAAGTARAAPRTEARRELTSRRIELAASNRVEAIVERAAIDVDGIAAAVDRDRFGLRILRAEPGRQQPREITRRVRRRRFDRRLSVLISLNVQLLEARARLPGRARRPGSTGASGRGRRRPRLRGLLPRVAESPVGQSPAPRRCPASPSSCASARR